MTGVDIAAVEAVLGPVVSLEPLTAGFTAASVARAHLPSGGTLIVKCRAVNDDESQESFQRELIVGKWHAPHHPKFVAGSANPY